MSSAVDDDDDDDDVATRVAPARDLLPAHFHDQIGGGGYPQPLPAAGAPAVPQPLPAAGAPPPGMAAAPIAAVATAPGGPSRAAPTIQLSRPGGGSLLDTAPRWVVLFNVACAVLTALGVLVLVILKVQGKW